MPTSSFYVVVIGRSNHRGFVGKATASGIYGMRNFAKKKKLHYFVSFEPGIPSKRFHRASLRLATTAEIREFTGSNYG